MCLKFADAEENCQFDVLKIALGVGNFPFSTFIAIQSWNGHGGRESTTQRIVHGRQHYEVNGAHSFKCECSSFVIVTNFPECCLAAMPTSAIMSAKFDYNVHYTMFSPEMQRNWRVLYWTACEKAFGEPEGHFIVNKVNHFAQFRLVENILPPAASKYHAACTPPQSCGKGKLKSKEICK